MLLLGIDIGTSSVKVSVVDSQSQQCLASATFPETEAEIITVQPGWAEQSPDQWWEHVKQAILKCHNKGGYNPQHIGAIGIAYQMHGLVLVDKEQHVLRNAIIWCDSRAVEIGSKAFTEIGESYCLSHLLNSPGNFTASKLAWVKQNEPGLYAKVDKVLLPGDYIAMKMTGDATTTISALSEGIFWDFKGNKISREILNYFGFDHLLFPSLHPLFAPHGYLKNTVAERLLLKPGIPVTYKAGDQPNNALSLNVLRPGEVATTAGTSGVIYGVSQELEYDSESRINSFAHVNYEMTKRRIGVLLCINGAGIFNRWMKNRAGLNFTYEGLNKEAAKIPAGAENLLALPFGNGAERMLNNQIVGGHFLDIDFNVHTTAHMVRSVQESIAFAFRYGLDIMRENGITPSVVRAGKANMFLSDVFTEAFTSVNNMSVEFYDGDGSYGAAIGAGIGAGIYANAESAFINRKAVAVIEPAQADIYSDLYERWKEKLTEKINSMDKEGALSFSFT